MSDNKKSITVDVDTLDALIEAKVQARLAGQVPTDPLLKRMQDAARPEQFTEQLIACKSPGTGSTFTARVVKSRAFPNGRVVELLDYLHPAGIEVYEKEGGLVPEGTPILTQSKDGVTGGKTFQYKRWLYENFWQRDLRDLVGRPFHALYAAPSKAA